MEALGRVGRVGHFSDLGRVRIQPFRFFRDKFAEKRLTGSNRTLVILLCLWWNKASGAYPLPAAVEHYEEGHDKLWKSHGLFFLLYCLDFNQKTKSNPYLRQTLSVQLIVIFFF